MKKSLIILFLCGLNAFASTPYQTQQDINHAIAKIVTTMKDRSQNNVRYGTCGKWHITTSSQYWEKIHDSWKDDAGKPIKDASGQQIIEPTILP